MAAVFKASKLRRKGFAMDVSMFVLTLVILNFVDSAIDNSGGGGCVYNFEVRK